MTKQFYLTHRWDPLQVLSLCVKVDLGAMVIKKYSTCSRGPELEPHRQMQFSVIPWILVLLINRWDPNKYHPSRSEWSWQWWGTPLSLKLKNWSCTIRCSLVSYPWHSFGLGVLPLCKNTISRFYSSSLLGGKEIE